jgi:hypothetical protein
MSLRYHVQNNVADKGWVTTAAFMSLANALHWAKLDTMHSEGWYTRLIDNKTGQKLDHTDPRMEDEAIMRLEIDPTETGGEELTAA